MSHITIIISKAAPAVDSVPFSPEVSYEYCIPIPDNATPTEVGAMIRRAYRRLEWSAEPEQSGQADG